MSTNAFSFDKEIFLYLNRSHNEFLDDVMFSSRNLLLWAPLCLLMVFMIVRYYKNRNAPHILITTVLLFSLIVLQVLLCVAVLPHFLEPLAQRVRPIYNAEIIQAIKPRNFSYLSKFDFFSAKVCAVLSISFFLIATCEIPRWLKFTLVTWALLISYSRIYIGAYYPLNILISDLIGVGIGLLAYKYYQHLKNDVLVI